MVVLIMIIVLSNKLFCVESATVNRIELLKGLIKMFTSVTHKSTKKNVILRLDVNILYEINRHIIKSTKK